MTKNSPDIFSQNILPDEALLETDTEEPEASAEPATPLAAEVAANITPPTHNLDITLGDIASGRWLYSSVTARLALRRNPETSGTQHRRRLTQIGATAIAVAASYVAMRRLPDSSDVMTATNRATSLGKLFSQATTGTAFTPKDHDSILDRTVVIKEKINGYLHSWRSWREKRATQKRSHRARRRRSSKNLS